MSEFDELSDEQLEVFTRAIRRVEERATVIATSINAAVDRVTSRLETEVLPAISDYIDQINEIIQQNSAGFVEQLETLLKGMALLYAKKLSYDAAKLTQRNWWIVPGIKNNDFYFRLNEFLEENSSQSEVDAFFCNEFRVNSPNNIESLVQDWTLPQFEKRKTIIDQALYAHKNHMFYLSIPALFGVFDGVAAEFITENLELPKHKVTGIKGALNDMYWNLTGNVLGEVLFVEFRNVIFDRFWEHSNKLDKESLYGIFNRNTIIHGENVDYGTEANSLRMFLLLHTLYWIIEHFPTTASGEI